jgi:hypothetical protein
MALAAVAAIGVGSAVIANAASSGTATPGATTQTPAASGDSQSQAPRQPNEDALSGETADKVRAAALDKVPGGEIIRLETDSGPAAYEAHVRKSDGSEVIVLVNSNFEVTDVIEGGPGGRGGPGRHDGRPCDRDGDGNPDNGSGSSQDQGTGFDGGSSSNEV